MCWSRHSTLLARSYKECASLLYQAVKNLQSGDIQRQPQDLIHPVGFYCSDRRIGDEILDWDLPSRDLFNFVRAICHPGPQARSFVGKEEIFINRVKYIVDAPKYKGIPGAVLQVNDNNFIVKTKDSFICVTEWNCKSRIRVGDRFQ